MSRGTTLRGTAASPGVAVGPVRHWDATPAIDVEPATDLADASSRVVADLRRRAEAATTGEGRARAADAGHAGRRPGAARRRRCPHRVGGAAGAGREGGGARLSRPAAGARQLPPRAGTRRGRRRGATGGQPGGQGDHRAARPGAPLHPGGRGPCADRDRPARPGRGARHRHRAGRGDQPHRDPGPLTRHPRAGGVHRRHRARGRSGDRGRRQLRRAAPRGGRTPSRVAARP